MSQYPPPNGYSQYYGQPPPQQFGYEFPPNYLVPPPPPPPFNQPFHPMIAEAANNTVQSSFHFNANHIPGLGIAGGQVPISQFVVPAGPGAEVNRVPSGRPGDVSFNHHDQRTATMPPLKGPATGTTHPAMDNDIEEGELNEEQFEDLYEPQESIEPTPAARDHQNPNSSANNSGVVSAADTPDAGFYANDEDETAMAANKKGDAGVNRERSGSYSPFLSPRDTPPNAQSSLRDATKAAEAPGHAESNKQTLPGLHYTPLASTNGPQSAPPEDQEVRYLFKSVEEARKEAQKGILRVWPLGVRYQQYIEEGFDESFIKSLFAQLHLDIQDARSQSTQKDKSSASKPDQPVENQQAQKNESAAPPSDSQKGEEQKGEQRKDRIARLLAAQKAAKPATPAVQAQQQPKAQIPKMPEKKEVPFSPPKAPAAMTRGKAWGEKDILLQQKIAALQEAQAQARKAQLGKPSSGPAQTAGNGPSTLAKPPVNNAVKPVPPAVKPGPPPVKPVPSTVQTVPLQSAEKPTNPQSASSIPGLLLSSIPTGPARNQRKRPVASDFVDVQPAARSNKRPFGQHRKETSLVIDISDASEDEEMDIDESPLEDPTSALPGGMASQRGPSIRDFPPLTNTPPLRQFSSPAPSSNTPLGHPILSKKRETELDIKEKEIQEMRRKIAEAEARRKAKQSPAGPLTPMQAGQTPESKDNEQTSGSEREASAQLPLTTTSARLPKKPDAPHGSQKVERRGRIVSLDLPRIDETIEEKMNRLKQLRQEEMRLQAEIDNQLARKKLLTEELEQLGDTSSDNPSQSNGLDDTSGMVDPAEQTGACPQSHLPIEHSKRLISLGVPTPDPGDSSEGNQQTSAAMSNVSEQNEAAADISMDEDESSLAEEITADNLDIVAPSVTNTGKPDENETSPTPDNTHGPQETQGTQEEPSQVASGDGAPNDTTDTIGSSPAIDTNDVQEGNQSPEFPASDDDPAPMEIESLSPSPSANPTPGSNEIASDETQPGDPSSEVLLEQLSSVTKPREAVQEIEAQATREVNVEPKKQAKSGFVPYESPLRYFRAYRFHPSYSETVRGGLRSLTYSNTIDPQKPFCPSELASQECPADCEFQHIRSIATPSDRILLELGKADEYSGEQKSRFIQGLRKLLGDIRENGSRDFDAIAREIIAFRSRFIGDPSKVLPLQGVTL